MIITQISPQAKDPLRENIYLDGKFGFGIAAEKRFEHRLKVGNSIFEKEVKDLVFEDQVGKLMNSSQRFLSFRPRSEYEVRQNIKKKLDKGDFVKTDKISDEVVKKLTKLGLVNDEEFAQWWIEQRHKFKPRGERLLRSELQGKRIDREIIDKLFHAYVTPHKEIDRIAEKAQVKYSKLPQYEFKRKLINFLARRGYDWDEISVVVDRLVRRL